MRGTVAKELRGVARKTAQPTRWFLDTFGSIRCEGYRKVVNSLKKSYYRVKRTGGLRARHRPTTRTA